MPKRQSKKGDVTISPETLGKKNLKSPGATMKSEKKGMKRKSSSASAENIDQSRKLTNLKDTKNRKNKTPRQDKMKVIPSKKSPLIKTPERDGEEDDSMVITFPKLESLTPKISTDLADPMSSTSKSKKRKAKKNDKSLPETPKVTQKKQKTAQKNAVNETKEKTRKQIELSSIIPGNVTVEEGTPDNILESRLGNQQKESNTMGTLTEENKIPNRKNGKRQLTTEENVQDKTALSVKKQKLDTKYRVFCGNLPPGTTEEILEFFFGECNIYPQFSHYDSRGQRQHNARWRRKIHGSVILTCDTLKEAEELIKLNGTLMPSPLNGQLEVPLTIYHKPDTVFDDCKMFIGKLGAKVNEKDITMFFESHDIHPEKVLVIKNDMHVTKRKKKYRFGFVWLANCEDVEKAVKLSGSEIRKKPVLIDVARNRDKKIKTN